jgi:hypothetical protein
VFQWGYGNDFGFLLQLNIFLNLFAGRIIFLDLTISSPDFYKEVQLVVEVGNHILDVNLGGWDFCQIAQEQNRQRTPTIECIHVSVEANADGVLQAAFGVPDGIPGHLPQVPQLGIIFAKTKNNFVGLSLLFLWKPGFGETIRRDCLPNPM